MFESEDQRDLHKKYNKMKGIGKATGKKFKFSKIGAQGQNPESVYGELKLSEKLVEELDKVRDMVDDLNERLEEAIYERDMHKSELDQVTVKCILAKKEVEEQKKQIILMRALNHST